MLSSGLLLLADSRLPSGGHGHSGGVEALVDRGLLATTADLAAFLAGRLATGGAVPAAGAAAACVLAGGRQQGDPPPVGPQQGHPAAVEWVAWHGALDARMPAAATRDASCAQGAALLRTTARAWPGLEPLRALPRVHHPLVLGAATAAAGGAPEDAALLALHHLVGGACTAAVRLLGLDPLTVAAVAAHAGRDAEPIAAAAAAAGIAAAAVGDPTLLPADGNPLHDVLAQLHRSTEATLFAS